MSENEVNTNWVDIDNSIKMSIGDSIFKGSDEITLKISTVKKLYDLINGLKRQVGGGV